MAVLLPRLLPCPQPNSWASEGCPGTAAPAWGEGGGEDESEGGGGVRVGVRVGLQGRKEDNLRDVSNNYFA